MYLRSMEQAPRIKLLSSQKLFPSRSKQEDPTVCTSTKTLKLIEWWNPDSLDIDARKKREIMAQPMNLNIYDSLWHLDQYQFIGQYWREDFTDTELMEMMSELHAVTSNGLGRILDMCTNTFIVSYNQKSINYKFFEDFRFSGIDLIINRLTHRNHPYNWEKIKDMIHDFYNALEEFIRTCDTNLYAQQVLEEIEKWLAQKGNGGIIWKGLRAL